MKIDQRYEVVRIDGDHDPLKEHPRNPNKGVEAIIDESIEENGWYGAVIAQESTGYIIAGNHRYRVAKQRGAKEIPVIFRDVDDETALKILLVDNQSTREGEFDEGLLEEILAGLDDLKGTGYVLASAQERIEQEADPDPAPPATESQNGSDPDDEADPLDPDSIPDDKYTPEYGVIVLCETAVQQKNIYEWLQRNAPTWDLKLTAV